MPRRHESDQRSVRSGSHRKGDQRCCNTPKQMYPARRLESEQQSSSSKSCLAGSPPRSDEYSPRSRHQPGCGSKRHVRLPVEMIRDKRGRETTYSVPLQLDSLRENGDVVFIRRRELEMEFDSLYVPWRVRNRRYSWGSLVSINCLPRVWHHGFEVFRRLCASAFSKFHHRSSISWSELHRFNSLADSV